MPDMSTDGNERPRPKRQWRGPGMEDVFVDDLPSVWAARLTPEEVANLNDERLRLLDREAERLREPRARLASSASTSTDAPKTTYRAHGGHKAPCGEPRRRGWLGKLLYRLVPKRGSEPRHPCGH